MNKKLLLTVTLLVLLCAAFLKFYKKESKIETKNKIEELRQQHASFLKNHPYQRIGRLDKKDRKAMGLPPNAYFEQKYLSEISPYDGRVHEENVYKVQQELKKYRTAGRVPGDGVDNAWVERGPDNVGGRTRAVLFDPNDATQETVFAGGVSGGLWKNTNISNANSKWERVGIPENLSVSCIAVDPNNSQIFYVGTGESYVQGRVNGDGVWKSTDGGNSWQHVFGGKTGASFFDTNSKLTVNAPASLAGDYITNLTTAFGGDLNTPVTGDLALVNDSTGTTDDACENITNSSQINGKIAVIRRGTCNFDDKVLKAQNAGAIAVVMINNVAGNPSSMGGDDVTITIPSVMISLEDGNKLVNTLSSETINVTLIKIKNNATNNNLVPGIHHINDIVVRNNAGTTEVYVAAGESSYAQSSPFSSIGADSYGIYKSIDGINFNKLNIPKTSGGNDYEPNNLEIAADNSIYFSTVRSETFGDGGGVIFKSTDGVSFSLIYTVPNGLRTEIALSKTNAGIGYILAQTSTGDGPVKIYKTTNGFTTASEISLPNDADTQIPSNDFTRGQAWYDLLIKVDPTNDNILYVGGIDLFKSTNGGTSWTQLSHWYGGFSKQYVHADQHGLTFANATKMLFSNDGGVYYSSNGGVTIQARNNNYNTLQFYTVGVAPVSAFGGEEYFLAGAQDNGTQLVEKASVGINSSKDVSGGDGAACFFDTDGTDKYYITNYVYNQSIDLYDYTTGVSRTINSENLSNGDFINQAELDSNLDVLYTNYSNALGKTVMRYGNIKNGTVVKKQLTNPLMSTSPSVLKISPYTKTFSKLYVGLESGKLLLVNNAESDLPQWSEITGSEFVGSISDIEFGANENEIFVTMHNYGVKSIWYTNDGGVNWSSKEGDFPDIPVKTILQNPLNREEVIIGTDLGVWKTSNFSSDTPKWTQSYNGMSNVPVLDLDLRDDNTVFAATYGRGIFSGKFTGETASIDDVIKGTEKFTVYPTISNGTVTVYGKSDLGKVKMTVYDIKGQEVYHQKIDFETNESNKIELNLSSGVYIMNIFDQQNRKSSKKIVIK
ncbi:PA domain-containing protein [Tenacibaculum sp. TC6]|uniref:PA domain-containing protein n=1 Tax=Tenacibaculum sp. TC6 TaxID=3423223 RepID=UPI003D369F2F